MLATHHQQTLRTRTVVAQVAVQNRRKHERLVEQRVNALLVRLDSDNAVLGE